MRDREALAIIEDICAVDGVDGIFVGPFDLSISMGMPGQFDAPEFQAAVTRIVAACPRSRKVLHVLHRHSRRRGRWLPQGL